VREGDDLTTFTCRISWNLGTLASWNPLGHTGPVTGLLYLYLYITFTLCVYLHIVSAVVRCTYYLLILLNCKATGVPRTHSAVTYLRSALIENNQCMSVMAVYCVVRQIILLRHTKFPICTDRQKQMQLITTCITTTSVAFHRGGTLRHAILHGGRYLLASFRVENVINVCFF
jgi:hypothetical protein